MRSIPMKLWLLAASSSLLQLLPFPFIGPLPLWGATFAWVCLVPLLLCLHLPSTSGKPLQWWQMAALGWLSGTLWWAIHCYWVYNTFHLYGGVSLPAGVLIQFILAGILGTNIAVFSAALLLLDRLFSRRLWAMPLSAAFLWVAIELFRARILGVPWDQLGVSQVDNPLLMHLPPWTGVYGVSFLIVLVNAMIVQAFAPGNRWQRTGMVAVGLLIALALQPWSAFLSPAWLSLHCPAYTKFADKYASAKLIPSEAPTASAILLQEGLEVGAARPSMSIDQMLSVFTTLSEAPASTILHGIPDSAPSRTVMATLTPPALIVWPESPAPFFSTDTTFRHWLSALASDAHSALIVGSLGVDPAPDLPRGFRVFNSANFVDPNGIFVGRYDKIHLVPFGEYVPFRQQLFFVHSLTAQIDDMARGTHRNLFYTGGHSYGTFICYEDAFANEVRNFAREGADVLVTISDDGWYGDSGAPWQHLNLARMRAIENHRWLLRSTDTGISAVIDPNGIVRESAPRHIRTAVDVHFGYVQRTTFYTEHGDWFAYACVLGVISMIALGQQIRYAEHLRNLK